GRRGGLSSRAGGANGGGRGSGMAGVTGPIVDRRGGAGGVSSRPGGTVIRRTKIVATLGPATQTDDAIAQLLEAGVNVVRINASHGTPEVRGKWIRAVRRIADQRGLAVAVLVDLQGPRIRVGDLKTPVVLVPGTDVVFAPEEVAKAGEI